MHRLLFLSSVLFHALLFAAILMFNGIARCNIEPHSLHIIRITPDGTDVPRGSQIVFQFNQAVVPVGRMERDASEIPITIAPKLDCRWRWLNTSALACQLDEKSALMPATRYEICVNPGITAEDGATLSEPMRHSFITERPKVMQAWFKTWESPGTSLIRVQFSQPVSLPSVAAHVFMIVDDKKKQRIALNVVTDPDIKDTPFILPVPGEKVHLFTGSEKRPHPATEHRQDPQ